MLFPASTERVYPTGQIVIYIGDQPSHVFFIKKGALKNYDIDENGSENILTIIGEGGFFSVLFTIGGKPEVNSFYSTLDETTLILIPIEEFREKLDTDIEFTNRIFKWFASEIFLLMDRIKGLEQTEGKMKVAHVLDYLHRRHGKLRPNGWHRVQFPVNQQLLADLAGLTRETISIIMKEFDEMKIIRYPKQMQLEINQSKLTCSFITKS